MEKLNILEDSRVETRLLNEFDDKMKFEIHQLDYRMFSNVIQKARRTVELNKIYFKQRQENTPVTPIENTNSNLETCPGKTNDNGTIKAKRNTLTSDINFVIGFLEYGKSSLADAQHLCNKTTLDINSFKKYAKYIEANLHIVRDSEFPKTLDGKVNDDDLETVISLNDDILVTGRDILLEIQETLKNLNFLMKKNAMNFKIISDAVSKVSSLSIEKELVDNRDSLFDIIKQADNQITMAHEEESKANHFYDKLQPNLLKLHRKSSDFIQLYSRLAAITVRYGLRME